MKETEFQKLVRAQLVALLADIDAGRQESNPVLAQAVRDVLKQQQEDHVWTAGLAVGEEVI